LICYPASSVIERVRDGIKDSARVLHADRWRAFQNGRHRGLDGAPSKSFSIDSV